MSGYAAHVRTDVETLTDSQIDCLVDDLRSDAGSVSMLGGRLSLQLTVGGTTYAEALARALGAVHVATHVVLGRAAKVVGVELLTAEEFDRQLLADHEPANTRNRDQDSVAAAIAALPDPTEDRLSAAVPPGRYLFIDSPCDPPTG